MLTSRIARSTFTLAQHYYIGHIVCGNDNKKEKWKNYAYQIVMVVYQKMYAANNTLVLKFRMRESWHVVVFHHQYQNIS